MTDWAQRFSEYFIRQLADEGYSAEQIVQWAWKPYRLDELRITGADRDLDCSKLKLHPMDVREVLARPPCTGVAANKDFYFQQKFALVMLPGFTHETLKNLSWHEQIERKDSPHHIVMLKPGFKGEAPQEQEYSRGDGLKIVYVKYPRSNAASRYINEPMFDMLHRSQHLRNWVNAGYRLVFVGYSYGASLALELLADLHAGRFTDEFILKNTAGFLGLCGDIGGSYVADDILSEKPRLVSIRKVIDFSRRHPFIGRLLGLGSEQLLSDMEDGIRSLAHEGRQSRIREYTSKLPPQLKYFSVGAVLPLQDYKRRWWQFNFDDYSMYRQAQVSDAFSVYNDGQMVLADNLVPDAPQIAPKNNIHLGVVRTHHWGVSYKTFNFGRNKFPRQAFYRTLLQTVIEALKS